jgi:hypothetical protein
MAAISAADSRNPSLECRHTMSSAVWGYFSAARNIDFANRDDSPHSQCRIFGSNTGRASPHIDVIAAECLLSNGVTSRGIAEILALYGVESYADGHGEKRMKNFTIRLLTLAMFATPLTAIPRVSPADAATNGKTHVKKHTRQIQRAPAAQNANKSQYPSYENDFDRRNAGGGGGY